MIKLFKFLFKHLMTFLIMISTTLNAIAQGVSDLDELYEKDESISFSRYANLNLTNLEKLAIVAGIILLLIAIKSKFNKNAKIGIGCIGLILSTPLIFVIYALFERAWYYGILLMIILGVLALIFKNKNNQ